MPLIPIDSLGDPRVDDYRDLKDAELRRRLGLFVVEGRENLRRLVLRSPFRPRSVLLGEAARRALAPELAKLAPETPIFEAPHALLETIAGYSVHHGCLAVVPRPPETGVAELVATLPQGPSRVVVMEGLTNHDNVGGLFRNAMAFGVDAAVLCPRCCDPFYRKAIRTSMGGSLCVPFARAQVWPDALSALRDRGYTITALDPGGEQRLGDPSLALPERIALLVGAEGCGLTDAARACADLRIRIEMRSGIDSINVATAAAIALHRLHVRAEPSS